MPTLPFDQGCCACPLDEVVHVAAFLAVEKAEGAAGATGAATVRDDVHIAARHEEVAGAGFDEACRCAEILNLPRIGRCCNQHRISTGFRRTMHICQQCDSITHRHGNVVIVRHGVRRLRQVAIVAASGLRTVESTLSGLDAGRLNGSHGNAPVFGKPIRYQSTFHPDSLNSRTGMGSRPLLRNSLFFL